MVILWCFHGHGDWGCFSLSWGSPEYSRRYSGTQATLALGGRRVEYCRCWIGRTSGFSCWALTAWACHEPRPADVSVVSSVYGVKGSNGKPWQRKAVCCWRRRAFFRRVHYCDGRRSVKASGSLKAKPCATGTRHSGVKGGDCTAAEASWPMPPVTAYRDYPTTAYLD